MITIITWMIPQLTQCPLPKNLIYHLMEILIKVYDLYHALHILDQIGVASRIFNILNDRFYVGLPSSLVEAEERRRKSSESSMSGGKFYASKS